MAKGRSADRRAAESCSSLLRHRVRKLCQRSHDLRFTDPAEMRRLAQEAERLARREGSEDLRALALVHHANALRIAGELARARSKLERASRKLDRCPPETEAAFLATCGSLECDLGRFDQAQLTLDRLRLHCEAQGDREGVGRTLIHLGNVHWSAGRPGLAWRCVREGLAAVDGRRQPWLLAGGLQLQVSMNTNLHDLGEHLVLRPPWSGFFVSSSS